ncbi:hypothetical protein [Brevibacillus sp. NRS-1366]|uniref:hypothetical protein n=1 Tax=Brevibacillus sp. NRS-1366 TaxID=3233899 RepID=UPI003D2130EE
MLMTFEMLDDVQNAKGDRRSRTVGFVHVAVSDGQGCLARGNLVYQCTRGGEHPGASIMKR